MINLAAMRLFQFKANNGSPAVSTYPIGIGSTERPSPTGQMYVQHKTVRPTWHVPASIAEDHRKKGRSPARRDFTGASSPPGRIRALLEQADLTLIHPTNKPYSIGLNVTNGCIRLYPEDITGFTKTPRSILPCAS